MINSPAPYKEKQGVVVESPDHELWMRSHDDVHRTASDIVDELLESDTGWIDLACIGAACVNQAMKAVAVARERLMRRHKDIVAQPWFSTITDDQERSRTRLMFRLHVVFRPY
jgi:stage V sporulation protein SpoVS